MMNKFAFDAVWGSHDDTLNLVTAQLDGNKCAGHVALDTKIIMQCLWLTLTVNLLFVWWTLLWWKQKNSYLTLEIIA